MALTIDHSCNYIVSLQVNTSFVFCTLLVEFEKQRLGSIRPLEDMVVTTSAEQAPRLHDDEAQWKILCEARFGITVSIHGNTSCSPRENGSRENA